MISDWKSFGRRGPSNNVPVARGRRFRARAPLQLPGVVSTAAGALAPNGAGVRLARPAHLAVQPVGAFRGSQVGAGRRTAVGAALVRGRNNFGRRMGADGRAQLQLCDARHVAVPLGAAAFPGRL